MSELGLVGFRDSSEPLAPQNDKGPQNDGTSAASFRINLADTSGLGLPEAEVRIVCSKGTYIRAFARDLGEALGSGAHLAGLVRSRSGDFRIADALSLEEALGLLGPATAGCR